MKKILIILPYVPYPLQSGGQIAVFEMINYLRSKFQISIIVPQGQALNELGKIWPDVVIHPFTPAVQTKVIKKISILTLNAFQKLYSSLYKTASSSVDLSSNYFFEISADFIGFVNGIINADSFDYVQVEFYEYLPLVCFLPGTINSIFIHHEIRYVRNQRGVEASGDNSILTNFILASGKGQEIELLKRYKKVVTVSDTDKTILSEYIDPLKLYSSPLVIKSAGADNINYNFQNSLFFLGGSDHSPNVNALNWFLENCWPALSSAKKDLKLIVIGSWDIKKATAATGKSGIEFLGFVDDLKTVFKNGILVVPMRIGSGMRMKIIDAVNYGVPFVTTTIGVEGLDFKTDTDCFIADSPEEFTAKTLELVNSENLQKTFISNSQSLIRENSSYDKLMHIREKIYTS